MPENQEKKLEKLLDYIENSDRGFCAVEVNEAYRQEEIVNFIYEKLTSKKIMRIDFKSMHEDTSHLTQIRKLVGQESEIEVVLVVNLQILSEGYGGDMELAKDINLSRDVYAEMGKLLVFFFPTYFVDTMMQHAQDFWDFVPLKFKFLSENKGAFQAIDPDREMADERYLRNRAEFLEKVLQDDGLGEKERLETLVDVAGIYNKLYLYNQAFEKYKEGLELATELGDEKSKSLILAGLASVYYYQSSYDEALQYLDESLKISIMIDDKQNEGTMLNNISQIYKIKGEYDKALEYFENSLVISRDMGDKSGEAVVLHNIGSIYMIMGNYREALRCLEKSLKISSNTGDKKHISATLNSISGIYKSKGDIEKSLESLEESLTISREIGDKYGEAVILNNIGRASQDRGDYERAFEYFNRSLAITREIGDRVLEKTLLENISELK